MGIEVGEWIRTKQGYIAKVISTDVYLELDKPVNFRQTSGNHYAGQILFDEGDIEIAKHSKEIIGLIEVGDIVNGFKIYGIEYITYNNHVDLVFTIFKTPIDFTSPYKVIVTWQEKDIKSILTHEMYEQNCYKVGGINGKLGNWFGNIFI